MSLTKVMHITYDMRIGGTEMVIKNLIDGIDKDTFEMSVLCIESPLGPFAKSLIENNIQFHELNRTPGFDIQLIKKIHQIIKKEHIDIIHCHQYTPWVYGVFAAMFCNIKVVFTEHGRFYPDSSSWKRKLINPILNLFTDRVTAISKATKQAIIEFENISEKHIEVIYNGITPLQFNATKVATLRKTLKIPDENTILGTVARFDPIKNHTMMLKGFAKVLTHQPNCTLLIVGDGEERENIEKCITNLAIDHNVILVGYKSQPAEYIALMDIFLLSSLSEGTSMTLLEAMSINKPCVVTEAGGNPEIISHNINGKVSINNDAEKFSDAILEILSSPSTFNKYSKASGEIFRNKFSASTMTTLYTSLYSNILHKKSKPLLKLQSKK